MADPCPAPPPLPHVTTNIIPLLNVLRFHTQDAYKQLHQTVQKLATSTAPDVARKLALLDVIVAIRHDFVKIYTLVKWAQRSKEVSRLIDLLNWLRAQETHLDHLALGVGELGHFSGAKLPSADLPRALEVLAKGRPHLPSYNHIPKPRISPHTVLRVLRDLNLALTARMALAPDVPRRFHNNYVVRDGRVVITIPGEFQVSVTVANDVIVTDAAEFAKSPFFFIDFVFLFGINPETALITHHDSRIVTALPPASHRKLEAAANQVLLMQSLSGLYEVLHKCSISFKLYLISRQLKQLCASSKWCGHVQFKYSSSLIVVNYWSAHYLARGWRAFVEIGIDRRYNLSLRWFKNGRYELSDVPELGAELDADAQDLSIDATLTKVVHRHSEKLMAQLHRQCSNAIGADAASLVGPHQMLIEFTPRRSTVLAINPLTGQLYFSDPSPTESQYQTRLNSAPTGVDARFVSEHDAVRHVADALVQLRLDMANRFLRTKLVATEWIPNDFIALSDGETARVLGSVVDPTAGSGSGAVFVSSSRSGSGLGARTGAAATHRFLFYRCRNWPAGWFMFYMIAGHTLRVHWWVARTRSIQGEWKLQWLRTLDANAPPNLDHRSFHTLSTACSNMIVHHLIAEDLDHRGISHVRVAYPVVVERFHVPAASLADPAAIVPLLPLQSETLPPYESVLALHNTGNLLPLSSAAVTVFLVVRLLADGASTRLLLALYGALHAHHDAVHLPLDQIKVTMHPHNVFELLAFASLSGDSGKAGEKDPAKDDPIADPKAENLAKTDSVATNGVGSSEDGETGAHRLLHTLFRGLHDMATLMRVFEQLDACRARVLSSGFHEVQFAAHEFYRPFTLVLPNERKRLSARLICSTDERPHVRALIDLVNQVLATARVSLAGCVRYLHECVGIFHAADAVRHALKMRDLRLANNLPHLQFDFRFVSLGRVQFVFHINSIHGVAPRRVHKDRIVFAVTFARNRFDPSRRLLCKFSMNDNMSSENLKFRKLFEHIYRATGELQRLCVDTKRAFLKLNYDFLTEAAVLESLMARIAECFVVFLEADT